MRLLARWKRFDSRLVRVVMFAAGVGLVVGGWGGPAVAQTGAPALISGAGLAAIFEAEGPDPFGQKQGPYVFSALVARFDSGNGHGYRNELKVKSNLRRPLAETTDHFSATITPTLPNGATTIVCQYHVESLDTLVKVYVQDRPESGVFDGIDSNGVFDVLVRTKGTDGREVMTDLGAVRSGESFDLRVDLDHGLVSVEAVTKAHGKKGIEHFRLFDPGKGIYLKFGDYLQAWEVGSGKQTTEAKKWMQYYESRHIDAEQIAFSNLRVSHEIGTK